jgi:hypothetical protein
MLVSTGDRAQAFEILRLVIARDCKSSRKSVGGWLAHTLAEPPKWLMSTFATECHDTEANIKKI